MTKRRKTGKPPKRFVKLVSSDGEEFLVEHKIISASGFVLSHVKEDYSRYVERCEPITVEKVNGKILRKVIEYCTWHHGRPKLTRFDPITKWDRDFVSDDLTHRYELITAAYEMKVDGLLDVGCRMMAELISGKSPEQIRQLLHIKKDMTEEDEKEAQEDIARRKQNPYWQRYEARYKRNLKVHGVKKKSSSTCKCGENCSHSDDPHVAGSSSCRRGVADTEDSPCPSPDVSEEQTSSSCCASA